MKAKQVQVRKYTTTQINMLVQRMVEDGKAQADKLAAGGSVWELRNKVQALGDDFKFKLTMAEHTDHEKHMQEFAAAVAKLLK